MKVHEEFEAEITRVLPFGFMVAIEEKEGFIDQTKHASWWDDTPIPRVGDVLRVVLLDDLRKPVRFSALESDMEVARKLK